jgi:hypothetical protein
VNVGRGSVVDEEAVADALEENRLGGYAADVFAMEDWALPGHRAEIPPRLPRHPRALSTPHLGSAVTGTRRAMSLTAARQVRQALGAQVPERTAGTSPTAAQLNQARPAVIRHPALGDDIGAVPGSSGRRSDRTVNEIAWYQPHSRSKSSAPSAPAASTRPSHVPSARS